MALDTLSTIIDMITDTTWNKASLNTLTNNLFTYTEMTPADCYPVLAAFVKQEPRAMSQRAPIHPKSSTRDPVLPLDSFEARRLWPPRSRADTRNTRLTLVDMWPYLSSTLKRILMALDGLDLITITNLAVWATMWGHQHLVSLWRTGCLNDAYTFVTGMSKLSAFVKRLPGSQAAKQMFCEASTLAGYVHEPWPDFKFDEEVPLLAEGGMDHGPEWLDRFSASLDEVAVNASLPDDYVSFEEFVKGGQWMTAGSASIGTVEWTYGENKGKFKARKNMVCDIYTDDEIYQMALDWDGTVPSRPFTKNEMGKIRLAVASGFPAYLNEAYVFRLFGSTYRSYTGVTLDEPPLAGHNRMVRCTDAFARDCYGLPWDYKRFDHQVSTDEMEVMFSHVYAKISHLLPSDLAAIEHTVMAKVKDSYRKNIMLPSNSGVSQDDWVCNNEGQGRVLYAPPGHGKSTFISKRKNLKIADTDDWSDCDMPTFRQLIKDNDLVVTNLWHLAKEVWNEVPVCWTLADPLWCENIMASKVNRKLAKSWMPRILENVPPPHVKTIHLAEGQYIADYISVIDDFCGFRKIGKSGTFKTPMYHVTGGLPSGIRGTSVYGNLWNAAMTQTVRKMAVQILGYDPVIEISLKGDDALLIAKHPAELYVLRVCYAACNLEGNDAKFGISLGQGEFLRDEYSPEHVRGWSARLICSITQYKPWGSGTWDPNQDVAIILNSIAAVQRRSSQSLKSIEDAAIRKWTKVTLQSAAWLALPKRLGGLGLLPWGGLVPSRLLPRTRRPLMKFGATHTPAPTWIDMTPDQHQVYCDTIMTLKTHDIDVPGTAAVFSRPWVASVRRTKVTWKFDPLFVQMPMPVMAPTIHDRLRTNTDWPNYNERNEDPVDSRYPKLLQLLREYTNVKRSSEFSDLKIPSLSTILQEQYPRFWQRVADAEARGWHRTDAIELAKGQVPTEPVNSINPILTVFVQRLVEPYIKKLRKRRYIAGALSTITAIAVECVKNSPIHRLYLW